METAKELHRDMRGLPQFEALLQDLRYTLRALIKNPGVTVVAILMLALGIGANIAICTVINAVLLRPLRYANSKELVTWRTTSPCWTWTIYARRVQTCFQRVAR